MVSWLQGEHAHECTILSNLRVLIEAPKWTKALIRAQKIIRKGEKATVILAEPQVLRQWDDVAQKVYEYYHRV